MFFTRGPPQGPILPHFLPLAKAFLASLGIRLTGAFIKMEILQNEVLPDYHDPRQSPRKDVKDIGLSFPDNRQEISGGKKRLIVPLARGNLKQPVQPIKRGFLHQFNQATPPI